MLNSDGHAGSGQAVLLNSNLLGVILKSLTWHRGLAVVIQARPSDKFGDDSSQKYGIISYLLDIIMKGCHSLWHG